MIAAKVSPHRRPLLLIEEMRLPISEVFARYQVPTPEAEKVIQQLVLALLYKWDSITNHEHWLVKTLEQKCQRLFGS
jgi:hypothetical protein